MTAAPSRSETHSTPAVSDPQSPQAAVAFNMITVTSPVMRRIQTEVCRRYKVGILDLLGPSRLPILTAARFEAYWRCRQETPYSYPQIGRAFNRHHSTVLHGVRMHNLRLDRELQDHEPIDVGL